MPTCNFRSLTEEEQVAELNRLIDLAVISQDDAYLEIYPRLLQAIQSLFPLDESKVLLAAHAVFGWMPTQLKVTTKDLPATASIVIEIMEGRRDPSEAELWKIAATFKTSRGNSVVSAAKLLHFLSPDQFPIWDSKVAKIWGSAPSGKQAAESYLFFTRTVRKIAATQGGRAALDRLSERLLAKGYRTPLGSVRAIELAFFLQGSH